MSDLCDTMRRSFAAIATRRIPPNWTSQEPVLGEYARIGDLVVAVRDDIIPTRSDAVVAALVRLAPDHPDATFVLTEALAPLLFRGMPARRSHEFRDSVLTDLACTILDARDVEGIHRLGQRLSRRAFERSRRRLIVEKRRVDNEAPSALVPDRTPAPGSPEHETLARAECEAVCETILAARQSGKLTDSDWEIFRTGSLEPNLGYPRPDISKNVIYKRTRKVRRLVAHAY